MFKSNTKSSYFLENNNIWAMEC